MPKKVLPEIMPKVYGSKRLSLALEDLRRIGIGALVAAGGALLTYISENLGGIDFGDWTPAVVALLSVIVNVLRKYLSDTTYRY